MLGPSVGPRTAPRDRIFGFEFFWNQKIFLGLPRVRTARGLMQWVIPPVATMEDG
jgi:hypothetical protein